MDMPVLRFRHSRTLLGPRILLHNKVGHTIALVFLMSKERMVSRQWGVILWQVAALLLVLGHGARNTMTITCYETTQMVSTTLLACYEADVAIAQGNQSIFGPKAHEGNCQNTVKVS
jgi:hypothetical protein